MTRRRVTDEQYGQLHRRIGELARRVDEGTVPFDKVMAGLCDLIENRLDGAATTPTNFPIWRTVKLGTFKDVRSLKKALERNSFRVSDLANDLLGQPAFALATKEIEIQLVKTTVADLGFPKGATLREIYNRARELGLNRCPAEVGPQLRLQYPDQPRDEWLIVAMEPISGSGGNPCVFGVGHDDGDRWLGARWGDPVSFWGGDDRFVFVSK